MSTTVEVVFSLLSAVFIVAGSVFAVIGGIGVIRLPDFYSRLHGGGVTDTLGAGLLMTGLMLQAVKVGLLQLVEGGVPAGLDYAPWLIAVKLAMILFFLLITSPTNCHALAQAALSQGLQPQLSGDGGGEHRDGAEM